METTFWGGGGGGRAGAWGGGGGGHELKKFLTTYIFNVLGQNIHFISNIPRSSHSDNVIACLSGAIFILDSRMASFWLSACSVLIVVPLF